MKVFRRDRKASRSAIPRNETHVERPAAVPNAANAGTLPPSTDSLLPPVPAPRTTSRTVANDGNELTTNWHRLKTPLPSLISAAKPQTVQSNANLQTGSTHISQTTQLSAQDCVNTPNESDKLIRLAQLPSTQPASLATLLPQGPQKLLLAADVVRADLVNTMANFRERPMLVHALDAYRPYAIAIARVSAELRKNGETNIAKVPWSSGLVNSQYKSTVFQVSLEAESAMICMLSGMTTIREVLETPCKFGMGTDVQIVEQIKSLQKTAGLFKYVHECVAPNALGQHSGTPPPEIVPAVSNMLSALAIATAQTLHVRRAIISKMSSATVAKLGMAAREHVEQFRELLTKCHREQTLLSTDFDHVAAELGNLSRGWLYLYSANNYDIPAPKITAFEEAIKLLGKASGGRIVAQAAKESLETLQRKLDDAKNENKVVHRESVPTVQELVLPQGRSLISVTEFEPPTVPEDDTVNQS